MRLPLEGLEIDTESGSEIRAEGRSSIDRSLRLKIEHLCLEELNRNCSHFSADKYQQIEKMLLRIVGRIAEPLLGQIRGDGGRIRQAQSLRMISEAFELQEVERGQ